MRMLHKDTLGTRLTFDVYEFETLHGDMLQQYIISLGGGQDGSPMGSSLYRIAPDSRDVTEWRIDVSRGSMFNRFHGPWDPITPRKFSSPREAAMVLSKMDFLGDLRKQASSRTAAFVSLGTPWRFTVHPGRMGEVFSVVVDGETFRIAPDDMDDSMWRLDKADSMTHFGGPWLSIDHRKYGTPQQAAAVLVHLHNTKSPQLRLAMEGKTAMSSGMEILDKVIDRRAYYQIQKKLFKEDDQSAKLLQKCLEHFVDKFTMVGNEEHGFGRLQNTIREGARWDTALLRNNVFKIANELGIPLPSSMFASTQLEQEWHKKA